MNRQTLSIAATVLACIALSLAAPQTAHAGDLQLEGDISTEYPTDPSWDALNDNNINTSANLGVAYGLDDFVPLSGLRAVVQFSGTGMESHRFDGDYKFGWSRNLYLVGADWGPEIAGFMRPFARVSAGVARQHLEVTPNGSVQFQDSEVDFATKNSVGLELYIPFEKKGDSSSFGLSDMFTFGLSGQFGYLWQAPANFDGMRAPDGTHGKDDPWSRTSVNLGELNTNSTFWDVGLFFRLRL